MIRESIGEGPSQFDREELVGRLADEMAERLASGDEVDLDVYCERYPELAADVPDVYESVRAFQEFRQRLGTSDSSSERSGASNSGRFTGGRLGDFQILREIGRGGMGVVYEAEQISLPRRVALKVLPYAAVLDPRQLERFKNEARAAATLDHPGIVSVHSVGCERDVHFYAMQFIEGQSLAEVIADLRGDQQADESSREWSQLTERFVRDLSGSSESPMASETVERAIDATARIRPASGSSSFPLDRFDSTRSQVYFQIVARLGVQAAEALDHAHACGIVHRDIKPGNLLLDRDGKVHVADFGLARIEADAGVTMTGDILGTLRYMSPEQALAQRTVVDHRTDIYSLGATLYELATLTSPFAGSDRRELLHKIAFEEPRSPRKLSAAVPIDLETIILKSIAKDLTTRYASAAALADDLRRYLDNQPIRAKPPTLMDRTIKWSRRHSDSAWLAVGFLSMLTIVSVVAAVTISRFYRESEFQRARADAQFEQTLVARMEAEKQRETWQQEVYSLDMKAAFDAWDKGQVEVTEDLLRRHEPDDDLADVRTFSWYALEALISRAPPLVMSGHRGGVREVALHPDGNRLVSVGDDGTIRTWDLETGRLLTTIETSQQPLHALAISPDGQTVVTGNRTLERWSFDGDLLDDRLMQFDTTLEEAAFSPDGKYVAAGSRDSIVQIVALDSNVLRKFDVRSGSESIVFTDSGRAVTAICKEESGNQVRSWDTATGNVLREFVAGSANSARLFVATSCGQRLVVANGESDDLTFWDTLRNREIFVTPGIGERLRDLVLSPDDMTLVGGFGDGSLRVWQLFAGWKKEERVKRVVAGQPLLLPAHQGKVTSAAFVDDESLATCSEDGLIKVWQIPAPRPQSRWPNSQYLGKSYTQIVFTPDAQWLMGYRNDGRLCCEDAASRRVLWTIPYARDSVSVIEFSADGSRFVTVDNNDDIDVWDVKKRQRMTSFHHSHRVLSAALSPTGRWVAVTGVDGYTSVWDVTSAETLFKWKLDTWGTSVEFSPGGDRLALGSRVAELLIVRTDSWNVDRRLRGVSDVCALAFHPVENQLASAHLDSAIRIWELDSGNLVSKLQGNRLARIRSLAFHPSGKTLVAGTDDETVRIWHLPTARDHGVLLRLFRSQFKYAQHLAFSPDGRTIHALVHKTEFRSRYLETLETEYQPPAEPSQSHVTGSDGN